MIENTKKYQIILVFPPTLGPEKLGKTIEKVKQFIINQEGSLSEKETDKNQTAQLKKLSYPINKYEEAFYLTLNFSLPPKNVKVLNQELKMEDNLMRHIITTRDEIKIDSKEKIDYNKMVEKIEPSHKEEIIEKLETEEITEVEKEKASILSGNKSVKKADKAEIEDLDKKLEEILNE